MNELTDILSALDDAIGFSEQVRLTESKRIAGINQSLLILNNL